MSNTTLADFESLIRKLSASQIIFVLRIGEILQSGEETVESLSYRLQVPPIADKDLLPNCETQDLQML
ncbi:MAG: hypothetical protein K8F52_13455 [Candidatus Scalindua rubra]|nr:hypothetical protein [Candidatus Scalindua rubra]